MNFKIEHELPGRIRLNFLGSIPDAHAFALEELLNQQSQVISCKVYPRTGSLAITYTGNTEIILAFILSTDTATIAKHLPPAGTIIVRPMSLWEGILRMTARRLFVRYLLPTPIRMAVALWDSLAFIKAALTSLARFKLDAPVLDGTAVGVNLIKRDFNTASSTMFLLNLGEYLEDHTRDKSRHELIYSLLDMPSKVWLVQGSEEILVDASSLEVGDTVIVRMGSQLPVDGVVVKGTAMVNQATLTGESRPIERHQGDDVFAGTALEEGELHIRVKAIANDTRLRNIVTLVEQSESLKSNQQERMEHLANKIVPWNFLYAGVVLALTGSLELTSAALMVDYSCALRLTGSISSLAAMREAAKLGFTVKGSKFFEAMTEADTIVFDKTGTLTQATPRVTEVLAFDDWDKTEVLRLAACLEEHFPHPVARAVVNEAAAQGINHRERHAKVEYLVAHGIASQLEGKRVIIGSGHFVFEDEGVPNTARLRANIAKFTSKYSTLYLAVDGKLVGALCIDDPLKPRIATTLEGLRALGLKRIIMLTGDNQTTAKRIADQAGIKEFAADLLPEQKHAFVEDLRAQGAKVIMVGDGVNDSPALSAADVSIAMGEGAAIAREVANITLVNDDLEALIQLRQLSTMLMSRMQSSFSLSIAINTALLVLGTAGVVQPTTSSLIHNGTTVALCVTNARPYALKRGQHG